MVAPNHTYLILTQCKYINYTVYTVCFIKKKIINLSFLTIVHGCGNYSAIMKQRQVP